MNNLKFTRKTEIPFEFLLYRRFRKKYRCKRLVIKDSIKRPCCSASTLYSHTAGSEPTINWAVCKVLNLVDFC